MKLVVETKVNERQKIVAEFEGKLQTCLLGANALLSYKGGCGLCKSKSVTLQIKVAKGYKFIEYVCGDCGGRAQWGEYKEGGYFLKDWEVYDGRGASSTVNDSTSSNESSNQVDAEEVMVNPEDLGF